MATSKKKSKKKSKKSEFPEEHLFFFEKAKEYTSTMFVKGSGDLVAKSCIKGAGKLIPGLANDFKATKVLYTDSTNRDAAQLKVMLQRHQNAPQIFKTVMEPLAWSEACQAKLETEIALVEPSFLMRWAVQGSGQRACWGVRVLLCAKDYRGNQFCHDWQLESIKRPVQGSKDAGQLYAVCKLSSGSVGSHSFRLPLSLLTSCYINPSRISSAPEKTLASVLKTTAAASVYESQAKRPGVLPLHEALVWSNFRATLTSNLRIDKDITESSCELTQAQLAKYKPIKLDSFYQLHLDSIEEENESSESSWGTDE